MVGIFIGKNRNTIQGGGCFISWLTSLILRNKPFYSMLEQCIIWYYIWVSRKRSKKCLLLSYNSDCNFRKRQINIFNKNHKVLRDLYWFEKNKKNISDYSFLCRIFVLEHSLLDSHWTDKWLTENLQFAIFLTKVIIGKFFYWNGKKIHKTSTIDNVHISTYITFL